MGLVAVLTKEGEEDEHIGHIDHAAVVEVSRTRVEPDAGADGIVPHGAFTAELGTDRMDQSLRHRTEVPSLLSLWTLTTLSPLVKYVSMRR